MSRLWRLRNLVNEQWFSKPSLHQDHLKGVRHGFLGLPSLSHWTESFRIWFLIKFPGEAAVGLGQHWRTLPQIVHLLVGVELKDTTKTKKRKVRVLPAIRRKPGIFPKSVSSFEQQNWGSFKLREHTYSWSGFQEGNPARQRAKSHPKMTKSRSSSVASHDQHRQCCDSLWSCIWALQVI